MNTIFHKLTGFATALLLTVSMASCSYDSSEDVAPVGEKGGFTLNITSAPVGVTRSATDINAGTTEQAASKSTGEKSINRFVMAVFDNSDSYANLMGKAVATASGTTTDNVVEQKNFATGGMAAGDSIFVAANIPSAKLDTYKDYNKSQFAEGKLNISEALTPGTSGTLSDTDLPMFGKSAVTSDGEGYFSATVTLKHLVAKVSLNSLKCEFTGTAHESATFRPTQLFLINVPKEIDMQVTDGGLYCQAVNNTEFYQGEANNWSTNTTRTYADYLGTSVMASEAKIADDGTWSKIYSLYTLPNRNADNQTKLVIKGKYSDDGTDANEHDAYYAVTLAKAADKQYVEMNTIYNIKVTIKGDGAPDAYSAIPNYQNLTSTITYADWNEHTTTVTAGNGGLSYSTLRTPVVGDLYFTDGTWGNVTEYPDKTPIGIVFSIVTSDDDQARGYRHGYVMALKRANNEANVANWCTNTSSLQSTLITRTTPETFFSPVTAIMADMDGLDHCEAAETYCTDNSIDVSNLTAIQAAKSYTPAAPTSTVALPNSGWYLPSIGQQYLWLKNLANAGSATEGSTVYTGSETWSDNSTYWTRSSESTSAANAINDYVKAKLSTDANKLLYTEFAPGHYLWSSTERVAAYPFCLSFNTDGNLRLNGGAGKSGANLQVRAVLAF